jgi:hypothetical protein
MFHDWLAEEAARKNHIARFRWPIDNCTKSSDGPWMKTSFGDMELEDPGIPIWDVPTGLNKCEHCNRWVCDLHFYHRDWSSVNGYTPEINICKDCQRLFGY